MNKEKSWKDWMRKNKTIIFAGVSGFVLGAVGASLFLNNKEVLLEAFGIGRVKGLEVTKVAESVIESKSATSVSETCSDTVKDLEDSIDFVFTDVREYIRKLPMGQKASALKIESALRNGRPLEDGQTFVGAYRRRVPLA